MYISLNALRSMVDLEKVPFNTFVKRFSECIAEIENIEKLADKYKGICVAEVREVKKHPASEKLVICKVNIGTTTVQVCAGVSNMQVGDKVAYIAPGHRTPENPHGNQKHEKIRKAKLGGVESNGMIMSGKELGVNDDHSMILILPKDLRVGAPISTALDLDDTIIEVENKTFTHRPDAFGLIGIARECSAIFDVDLKIPKWWDYTVEKLRAPKAGKAPKISVKNPPNRIYIPRYTAVAVKDVIVSESPLWLQIFLRKHGLQSVNNIVDITNYVMLVTGQPMHAFDYDKIKGEVIVRVARRGEKIHALDDKVYTLDDENVVIADQSGAIALGGIIGGKESAISSETRNILLESASFDLYNIRRTSMKLGLVTDAVTRFGKGQDPAQTEKALAWCVELLGEHAGTANLSCDVYDFYPYPRKAFKVKVPFEYLYTRSGTSSSSMSKEYVIKLLDRLTLAPKISADDKEITVTVPTYRYDLKNKEDILEEVARIYGYNNIEPTLPLTNFAPVKSVWKRSLRDSIRRKLKESGGNELMTYSFVGEALYKKCNLSLEESAFRLSNPLSPDLEYMRTALVPSILAKVQYNLPSYRDDKLLMYEIGVTHDKQSFDTVDKLPIEFYKMGYVYTDLAESAHSGSSYYSAKQVFLNILSGLMVDGSLVVYTLLSDWHNQLPGWIKLIKNMYHPMQSAIIEIIDKNADGKQTPVGILGALHPLVIENLKLPKYTSACELKYDEFSNTIVGSSKYKKLYQFPSVVQDFCFVTDREMQYRGLYNAIMSSKAAQFIEKLELVDIFSSEEMTKTVRGQTQAQKQFTVRIFFNSHDKQISADQVELARKSLITDALSKVGAELKEITN